MPKKYITSIILLAVIALLVLAGYFYWWPKFQELSSKKKEIEVKDQEIKQREKYLSGLEILSEQLLGYTDEIAKINSALPSEPSIAALFNFFQKASSENGLILKDIELGGLYSLQVSEERIQKMPFSITVAGSYSSFKNFLNTVYKNARLIEVKSISFSSVLEQEEEIKDMFNFELQLETHAY